MPVTSAVDGGVATVTVDNPPVNALDDAIIEGLREAAEALGARHDVRAVVLAGRGERAFIAGADLRSLSPVLGPAGATGEMQRHVELTTPMFAAWTDLHQPVIAAATSNAIGGGLELALCCDFIVADPRARFGLPEVTLGLMPGGGGTQRLPRRIGTAAARELILLGRLLKAADAEALGLVDVVAAEGDALGEAVRLAERLASLPAVAVQQAKLAVRDAALFPLEQGLVRERRRFLEVAASQDAREGAEAFLEKRAARFAHT